MNVHISGKGLGEKHWTKVLKMDQQKNVIPKKASNYLGFSKEKDSRISESTGG